MVVPLWLQMIGAKPFFKAGVHRYSPEGKCNRMQLSITSEGAVTVTEPLLAARACSG
jgi:hypothetical protein